ncbi:serine/threonine protein kinase [Aphanomyces astaci]|uniref:Serine/threonine protein kinase n=1 Tax=Aphanomyces astaci TaxID=112090 RepID=W4FMW5_APHAT|nr:serine/threonine protein kinase [Aphanomyces astaci]ETV68159.1 serine/threonine protein kinase [Aphanomyces astaci]|eukprot:XP_009842458.1 serine/threonine protein kinase [Aphanomyces astaci]
MRSSRNGADFDSNLHQTDGPRSTSRMLRSVLLLSLAVGLIHAQACEVPKENTLTSTCFGLCAPRPTTGSIVASCLVLGVNDAKNGCTNQKDGTCTENVGGGACTISCLQPLTSELDSTWAIRVGVPTRQDADVGLVQAINDVDITPSTTTIRIAPRDDVVIPTSELRFVQTSFRQAISVTTIDIERLLVTNFTSLTILSKLKSLRLSNVGLAQAVDVESPTMSETLDTVDLSGNKLRELPLFLFRNKNLQVLNVSGNPLVNVHLMASELQFLQALQTFAAPVLTLTMPCQVGFVSTKWHASVLCVQDDAGKESSNNTRQDNPLGYVLATTAPSSAEDAAAASSNKTFLVLIGTGTCVVVGVFVYLAIFMRRPRMRVKHPEFPRGSLTSSAGGGGVDSSMHVMEATDKSYYVAQTVHLPEDDDDDDCITTAPHWSSSRSTWTVQSFRSLFTEIAFPDLVVSEVAPVVLVHDSFDMVRGKFKGKRRVHVNRLKPMAHDKSFVFLSLLSTLRHPRVTAVVGVSWRPVDPSTGGIQVDVVCEYMDGALLQTYLGSTCKDTWRTGKLQIMLDVSLGLMHIHEHNYVYEHLSPRTLLVDSARGCKLHTVAIALKAPFPSTSSTLLHVAPEVLKGEQPTTASDMYAYGVLAAHVDKITSEGIAFSPQCPEMVVQVAKSCLQVDPQQRPSASFVYAMLRRQASFIEA